MHLKLGYQQINMQQAAHVSMLLPSALAALAKSTGLHA
jgi:hypothetical protein